MNNVCIIGYGAIGPVHAQALENTENARLYGVCDIDPKKLEKCQSDLGVKTYESFDDVLKDKDIDSVHICTPHYLHFDMLRLALAAGKKVVCEKPVTMTKKEFDRLTKLSGAEGVCCVVQNRYNPCVDMLKKIADGGEYGNIISIRAVMTWHRDKEYYKSGEWRGRQATEGGGVLINQAVHTLDFMTYLCGAPKALCAESTNFSLKGIIETEDTVVSRINFKKGAVGIFFATNAYGLTTPPELEVVFENKTFHYLCGRLISDGVVLAEDAKPKTGKEYWGAGHELLIRKFYDKEEYFSPVDIKDTMNAMFAIYKSASNGGEEQILI